jgi:abortive infection bacteriophage resistance protein
MEYQKPYKTYQEQVELWVSCGLVVQDPVSAKQIFARLNYYRLSAYALSFQKQKDIFDSGTTWEDIVRLYEFDRELRLLIFCFLESIEVALKTAICHYLAEKYGPFGYIDAANFSPNFIHGEWYSKFKEEQNRSRETFIYHYNQKYHASPEIPLWMATEIMSFGSISKLYQGLIFSDQKNIGRIYGLPAPVLESWMHFLTYLRNLCAHHSRVWNRELAIRPKFPYHDPFWNDVRNNRIIAFFIVTQYLFNKIQMNINVAGSLKQLFLEYPGVSLTSMGFRTDWERKLLREVV